ncbi:methyltransferase domain-containing protein [Desulfobotulus sp. H1]|uniref:Methyltransferase domain-containing protein n=1 Tax=Desulfobotulus pelophilus TaxID=2823377 RepID=A0ABT3N7T6_9BACT|nr:class I SAM-dependent methyltransferase [Desulfobotulus pelophilus]MCW7753515.1 methyltransferase domain-containing protein [Desulfobotulus pelophilus]
MTFFADKSQNPMASIFEALQAPVRMAVLQTAVETGMADILTQASAPEDIAAAMDTEIHPENLVHFLDSMAGIGLAVKQDGRYVNSEFASTFLRKESPVYLGSLVLNLSRMQHRNIHRIEELVRTGPPPVKQEDCLSKESRWEASVRHLASYQRAGIAALAADIIDTLPESRTASTIMDIGCGPGLMCMEILQRHPGMKGVLFDLPGIIRLAEKEVQKEGMEKRISYIQGDYNTTDFGKGYDIIWASHNLYYVQDFSTFFLRLHAALNDGGVFVSLHEGTSAEGTIPEHVVLSRLSLALEGQNYVFRQKEIANHLRRAGFQSVETSPFVLPVGEVELTIARKEKG